MWCACAVSTAAVLVLAGTRWSVDGARILAVEPCGMLSNWNFMRGVLETLTDRGHNVTVFTPFPDGDRDNYTEVDVSGVFPIRRSMGLADATSLYNNVWTALSTVVAEGRNNCDRLHEHRRFRAMVDGETGAEFDAVIVEARPWDCLSYLAAERNLPLILTFPGSTLSLNERAVLGDASHPTAVQSLVSERSVSRTFAQRLSSTVQKLYENCAFAFMELLLKTTDPRPYESRPTVPPSLVFVNGHFVSDPSRPISSNVVRVGGVHLKPVKKIPQDILKFIDDSPNGVILFTFGSTVKISTIPGHIQRAFIEAIDQLQQRVLIKYEGEMKDKPKNVMMKKWLPQRDILMHPKVKLFISHGGISGVYEAVDAGVPILGFPLFWDQHRNINNLVESGMAISMELFSVTKDKFLTNILKLVNNKTYFNNAKAASKIFNDRPMSPKQSVIYWTEYVVRHKGAPHLKSHGHNLTWYQYFLLDVSAVFLIIICVLSLIINKIIRVSLMLVFKCARLYNIKFKSE